MPQQPHLSTASTLEKVCVCYYKANTRGKLDMKKDKYIMNLIN